MNTEIWKDIKDHEGRYQISSHGRVKNLCRLVNTGDGFTRRIKEKILTLHDYGGYLYTVLGYKAKPKKISRLVATHFIPNPENKPFVNHIDGNKHNDHVSNLEWCTPGENISHAHRTGLIPKRTGKKNPNSKLTADQVLEARLLFTPYKMSSVKIAKQFGVTPSVMLKAIKGITWQDIK